jgi:P-aminobenzoate N-oxygenase AurF
MTAAGSVPGTLLAGNVWVTPVEEATVSTYDHYTTPVAPGTWDIPAAGSSRFSWEYDDGRTRLLDLYQRGKDKQWDAAKRIDWSLPVNPSNVMEAGDEFNPIYGSRQWEVLNQKERDELGHHLSAWLFSQFLHGEQGALTVAARIVESVPDMDSKFYAATQAMDEARHVELYARFMREKIGLYYPVNPDLAKLLEDALSDSRWDMPYLGMQVLIEGLALAAFGVHRDLSQNPLVTQLLAYVMQDEARHVAFGRLALRDYYKELTAAERADREEFVVEGCYLMRNRFTGREVWERMGFDVDECLAYTEQSPVQQAFRTLLFSRIVPCVKDIGLWGPKVQHAYVDLGVIEAADSDLDALMRADEELAEEIDRRKYAAELAARQGEVHEAISLASQ